MNTEIEFETYLVNKHTGTIHKAIAGRLTERCQKDDMSEKNLVEVPTLDEVRNVTKRKVRMCAWCWD